MSPYPGQLKEGLLRQGWATHMGCCYAPTEAHFCLRLSAPAGDDPIYSLLGLAALVSLDPFSCFAAPALRQVPEERGTLDMSTQAGLMCLDKAFYITDRCRESSVPGISGSWAVPLGSSAFLFVCGFSVSPETLLLRQLPASGPFFCHPGSLIVHFVKPASIRSVQGLCLQSKGLIPECVGQWTHGPRPCLYKGISTEPDALPAAPLKFQLLL